MPTKPNSANLLIWWPFNGDANDAHGSSDLTEVNSPAYVTGLIDQAIDLDWDLSQYCTMVKPHAAEVGANDFTITGWVKGDDPWHIKPLYSYIVRCGNTVWSGGYQLRFAREDPQTPPEPAALACSIYSNDGSLGATIHGASVYASTWYFFAVVHDVSEKYWAVWGDATGSLVEENSVTYTGTAATPSRDLYVGADGSGAYLGAQVQNLAYWNAALVEDELAYLRNNGNGLSYADYIAEEAAGYNKVDLSLGVRL